jgi:hypothetical protein
MDRLERPVADRLRRQVAGQGLTLAYLDCPAWDGSVPSRMRCRGYLDGVVAGVQVVVRAAGAGIDFDAWLDGGLVATARLEDTLRADGWTEADCGGRPAYPARVGSRIVCRVSREGADSYVVATVRSRSGRVLIAGYRAARDPR